MNDPYGFLGKGWKFPIQVDKQTGHIAMVNYEEDIKEAIGIILNTYFGERVMRVDFGTNVADFIFSTANDAMLSEMISDLPRQLVILEPRITDVEVKGDEEQNAYKDRFLINVSYTVRTTNNRYNHVYPFYMDEGNQEDNII